MNLRRNRRRSAIVGAGAATLTAAAVALGPGTAVGAPADPADEVTQAVEEAVDAARQAAEDAAQAAQDAARSAQDAADQATQAAEDAAAAADDSMEDTGDTGSSGDDGTIDATPDQVDWIPQDLQEDLENLQDLPADQRAEEIEQILQDAVTGDYGEEVENWSERMTDFVDVLPEDLQNDLQNVIGMEPEAAQEHLREVWQGVLNGDYGQDAQMWGSFLRQSFQQWDLGQIIEGGIDEGADATD